MIAAYSATSQARVNAALETLFTAPRPELARLYEAMRYGVMNRRQTRASTAGLRRVRSAGRQGLSKPTVRPVRWS